MITLNFNELDGALEQSYTLGTTIDSLNSEVLSINSSLDSKILDYYSNVVSYFPKLNQEMDNLNVSREKLSGFSSWLGATIAEARGVDAENSGIAQELTGAGIATGLVGGNPSGSDASDISDTASSSSLDGINPEGSDVSNITEAVSSSSLDGINPEGSDVSNITEAVSSSSLGDENPSGSDASSLDSTNSNSNLSGVNPEGGAVGDVNFDEQNSNVDITNPSGSDVSDINSLNSNSVLDNSSPSGSVVGALSAVISIFSGFGSIITNNDDLISPLDRYNITNSAWNALNDDDKTFIINTLRSVGYSDKEIEAIINGESCVSAVLLRKLSGTLEEILVKYPELREVILKLYGFDVFDLNGKIDYNKLALLILIDMKKSHDKYDLLYLLYKRYNIELVSADKLSKLSKILVDLFAKNKSIRKKIFSLYGFDVFNLNGSVNYYNLIIAMLIDEFKSGDKFDLVKFLSSFDGVNTKLLSALLVGISVAATGAAVSKKIKDSKKNSDNVDLSIDSTDMVDYDEDVW